MLGGRSALHNQPGHIYAVSMHRSGKHSKQTFESMAMSGNRKTQLSQEMGS